MKAAKKQLNYILSLLAKLSYNLSKKQASDLIKKLLEVKNHGKRNYKTTK